MADLKGILLAAANEAEKMQHEFQNQIDDLACRLNYVETENAGLKNKLDKAKELFQDLANIFENDNLY